MNNIGFIIKNNKINNLSNEELQKYDNYISKIIYDHNNDIIKTFDYHDKQILFKNRIFHQFTHNFNTIIIKGTYREPFFGKLEDLSDITLTVIINKKLFKYYKI
jgi:hypothetical protein